MKTYEQVDEYMQRIGLKYIKGSNEFITGLAVRTDKNYAMKIAEELNSRANRQNDSNMVFYKMKNESLVASIYISAAFDGGLFRHLGNLIIDKPDLFNGRIIDMACDCGIVTCFIAQQYPQCKITGVDVNSSAIENAKELAQKLGLSNVDFVCSDVYEYVAEEKADTVTSFRSLLDVTLASVKDLPFFGEIKWREKQYCTAFEKYAKAIADNLKPDGRVLSVERYTADYGWLGWMLSLEEHGVYSIPEECQEMRASDISSVKDYTVTIAQKTGSTSTAEDSYCNVLIRSFKSGTGYDGYMAEFALNQDADGDITYYDIYKEDKILHQFASAVAKSGKVMYYEASGNKKRIKYANIKKKEALDKDLEQKLQLYNTDEFSVKTYKIQ